MLGEIKTDDTLKRIPVVVLTDSKAEADVLDAYTLHANCSISKPIELHQFSNVIKTIETFWISIVSLPKR